MGTAPTPNPPPGLEQHLPGLALLRGYRREWFVADLVAGASDCVVMIPAVIAYAGLIGLPPQYGLYAALIPLIVYPFFGSSRQVIVGPDIAISLLIAGAIAPLAGGDANRAVALASAISVACGLLLMLGARAKIGAVANFFSKPVLVGYMTGAALILVASQLNRLFGVTLGSNEFFPRIIELAEKFGQVHWPTLIFGLALVTLIACLRRFARKIPSALVVCVTASIVSMALDLERRGVRVVGSFPSGLPGVALPLIEWHQFVTLIPAIIGIALLTYTEGILLARAFAAKNNYEVNANRELSALGMVNVFAGLFQGFTVTGSQSRTAVNDSVGGRSQVTSLVSAATLALFLLFLTPLIAHLPQVALAAILIYGGFTLIDFGVMKRIYRWYPRSAAVAALTTMGVLSAGVIVGILVGVVLSLLGLINRISHPPDAVLREVPGHGFHDLGDAPTGQTLPGLLAYRFYAPLLFSNVGHFVERVRQLVAGSPTPVVWFLLDAQAITDIDVTAADALHSLNQELKDKGINLKVAHANRPLRDVLKKIGLEEEISDASFFPSVHECVEAYQSRGKHPLQ